MAGVVPPKNMGVPTSTTQHLQGLLIRRTATAEPKSLAQYFNHVADAVRVNDELTTLRTANLKRRGQVAAYGYEAVLNRKKRTAVHISRPSVTGPAYLTRATPLATPTTPSATVATPTAASTPVATPTITATTAAATPTSTDKTHPNSSAIAAAAAAAAAVSARAAAAKATARPLAPVSVAPAKPTPLLVQQTASKAIPVTASSTSGRTVPATMAAASAAIASSAATSTIMPTPMAVSKSTPLHVPPQVLAASQPIPMPANLAQTVQSQPMPTQPLQPQPLQPQPVASPQPLPRRADLVIGSRVMIRHTADLVACGARNLVGKTGRIVAVPQVYGQEVYSVYIDEHETMFQVPFNALVLISPPAPTPMPINMQHQPPPRSMHQLAPGGMISQAQQVVQPTSVVSNVMQPTPAVQTAAHGMRPTPSIEDIKLEHSYQLHRLMQQQYREIQVLQQQYAECRLVNPAALPSIQKELSKLRLVHLSQVQTLKSKQALDLLGK